MGFRLVAKIAAIRLRRSPLLFKEITFVGTAGHWCDASSLMATDSIGPRARGHCARAWFPPNPSFEDSDVPGPVRNLAAELSPLAKAALWQPMQGGLGGTKEFEEEAIEARSESSKWVEVLVEGKL